MKIVSRSETELLNMIPASLEIYEDRFQFILANTELQSPPHVPEIRLHLASEALPLWQKTEDELAEAGLALP